MMGRRGGNLKRRLNDESFSSKSKSSSVASLNKGRGQEITGVSLPAEGKLTIIMEHIFIRTRLE